MATSTPAPPTSDPGVIARISAKRDKWKSEADRLKGEHAAAAAELEKARKELADLKESGGDKLKAAQAELRTLKHRRAFDRLAKEKGVAEADLDDLFALSGYKAEADDPDEKAIGKLLDEAADHPSRSRYFAAAAEADAGQAGQAGGKAREEIVPEKRTIPPDAGRGARHRGEGTVALTREQLADPKFMLDPRNAALKAGAKIR